MLGIREKEDRKPFDVYLKEYYGGFLPSPQARWCTRVLKIKPFEREIGNDRAYTYIGIRADEQRIGYQQRKPVMLSEANNIIPIYPFQEDGIGLEEVKGILNQSGLGLPPYYQLAFKVWVLFLLLSTDRRVAGSQGEPSRIV